jgi:hypothetical protein
VANAIKDLLLAREEDKDPTALHPLVELCDRIFDRF